jgi:signal transduction histidine kinase
MVFESRPQCTVVAGALLLAGAGWNAGACYHAAQHVLPLAASVLVAALAVLVMRHGLASLILRRQLLPLEVPASVTQDQARLAASQLVLESRLEFAPVALFGVASSPGPEKVEPLNASARRLLAPGRATGLEQLHLTLAGLAAGTRTVIEFDTEHGMERALATASSMTVAGTPQRIVALLPMEDELVTEAMQAWQKLVHVLTHEIMNSLTPVASLSQTARDMLGGVRASLPADLAGDLDTALDAIHRRADSLAHFVSGYRFLASVPEADPQRVAVNALFARLSALFGSAWQARGGNALFAVAPASLELMADPGQLEQALANLLTNAAEATASLSAPEVSVTAKLARGGRLQIEVRDNGPGVQAGMIPHIFTPFFTTKSKGSGIGLAMVRQLVRRNGGTVRYARSLGTGARFIITF